MYYTNFMVMYYINIMVMNVVNSADDLGGQVMHASSGYILVTGRVVVHMRFLASI